MGDYLAEIAARHPDNHLIKRLPPQAFYTSYLSILVADVSKGARETWNWLAALCYMKKPIRAPTRNHFEVEFKQLTGIGIRTGRDHFAELMAVDLLRCYRTSTHEFLIYPVEVVPLPDDEELSQGTLLDVGDDKDESAWRKSANDVGENPPTPKGSLGSKASLKTNSLTTPKATAPNSRSKVGENPPTSRRKSAETTPPPPAFGENPPTVHPVKEQPTRPKEPDTSSLAPEALDIYERLVQVGFFGDPIVVIARKAVAQGYTADEMVTRAQTIIAEFEANDEVKDALSLALYHLNKYVARPPVKATAKTKTKGETPSARRVREALEAQDAAFQAELDAMSPEERQRRDDEYNQLIYGTG